jgi:outer membrane protein assembly factor BamA
MYRILLVSIFSFSQLSYSQLNFKGTELGFDGNLNASSLGGSFGIGTKIGLKLDENEHLIFGPSFRIQRTWTNNAFTGQSFSFNIYGGGIWAHYRLLEYFYLGAEFEALNSPINYTVITPGRSWIPSLFLGGGISKDFGRVRINGGVLYDVIDHVDSPFRQSYFMRTTVDSSNSGPNSRLIPIIYRIGFFFKLFKD